VEPFTRLAQRVGKDDQLSVMARLLFAALDAHLDKRTGWCAPTLDRLAGWLGRNERTIRRCLRQLEAAGYIAVDRSCGRRNGYRLLPVVDKDTPDKNDRGTPDKNDRGTPDKNDRGTPDKNDRGTPGFHHIGNQELREKEQGAAPPRPVDLFAGHYRDWFTAALRYHLADVPELAGFGAWFPALAAEFFLNRCWHRTTDPETAVGWAKALAAIAAEPAETAAAFAWALGSPTFDSAGRKVFSRPDHLARIVYRVQSQRRRPTGPVTAGAMPVVAEARALCGFWATATAAERAEVEATVARRRPEFVPFGLHWMREAADELKRLRAAAGRSST
jgi:hypothetical protein